MTKILVPTSGPTTAEEIADYIMEVAHSLDAEVVAFHVCHHGGSREAGELSLEYFAKAGEENGVTVECCFGQGPVIDQIVDFAEENGINLIVMGASQGRVVDQWISSDVRNQTTIPVLVVPYQIFD